MLLQTKHFGPIEMDDGNLLTFESGLPGFENVNKYVLINSTDEQSPFKWLQCVEEPELAFAVVNPFFIKKDYCFEISGATVEELSIENAEDIMTISIVVIPDDLAMMSMNLKAPVIINTKNNKAVQIILDTDKYTVRHYILDELRRQEVADNVGVNEEKGPDDSHK